MTTQLPLSHHPHIHTQSVEEARYAYGHVNTPIQLDPTERGRPFELCMNLVPVGPIAIATEWTRSGVLARTEEIQEVFTVQIPIAAGGEAGYAGAPVPLLEGGTAFLASPGRQAALHLAPGYLDMKIIIPCAMMEAAFTALTGEAAREPLLFEPLISITSGAGARMARVMRFLVDEESHEDGLLASPLLATRFADILVYGLLESQPHNHSAKLRPPRPAEPRYVRTAAEYLHAHAAEPVSIADVSKATGICASSLQVGFRRYRGCSPMEFLRERRLELARTRLLSGPGSTVAEIALACGFEHFGRFSALYRTRFGENPTETRRRTRETAQAH